MGRRMAFVLLVLCFALFGCRSATTTEGGNREKPERGTESTR